MRALKHAGAAAVAMALAGCGGQGVPAATPRCAPDARDAARHVIAAKHLDATVRRIERRRLPPVVQASAHDARLYLVTFELRQAVAGLSAGRHAWYSYVRRTAGGEWCYVRGGAAR